MLSAVDFVIFVLFLKCPKDPQKSIELNKTKITAPSRADPRPDLVTDNSSLSLTSRNLSGARFATDSFFNSFFILLAASLPHPCLHAKEVHTQFRHLFGPRSDPVCNVGATACSRWVVRTLFFPRNLLLIIIVAPLFPSCADLS